ncbi:MAG: sigma-54-dependent transcriptional regulator [Nitrospiria bacterium]
MKKILVVDDEITVRESVKMLLKREYSLLFAADGMEGLQRFQEVSPDLVLLDVTMPNMDGMAALKKLREIDPDIPIVMLTATLATKTAVEAMKAGANDYLTKPFDHDELRLVIAKALAARALEKEVIRLRAAVKNRYGVENIIGNSRQMGEIFSKIRHLADTKATILLTGESGTGKELVARALHFNSQRKHRPFIAINCAAIPDSLIESELFGHERGAFTDAQTRRIGQFEQADQGTLFLDEVADLSLPCQAKILRVLQEKRFTRIGGTQVIESDVRVITATNKDLTAEMKAGRFREDLYYRINVIPIVLPPLRERKEDIPLLVKHFLDQKTAKARVSPKTISQRALDMLIAYRWPGNIRELENIVEQIVALSSGSRIDLEDLPSALQRRGEKGTDPDRTILKRETRETDADPSPPSGHLSLPEAVSALERKIILDALRLTGGVQTRTARLLGISRRILKYKMDSLGISDRERQTP